MKQWVVVVGGTNMDVVARTAAPLVAATSNPGHARISPGGVGRNIAACLGLLGAPVRLVSAVGDDAFGDEALRQLGAPPVELRGPVRRLTDQHEPRVADALQDRVEAMRIAQRPSEARDLRLFVVRTGPAHRPTAGARLRATSSNRTTSTSVVWSNRS